MARDINPTLELREFRDGVSAENLDEFLRDVDVYVDGLDYFAFPARLATYAACARLSVPAVIAAPLGMGVALLNFLPGRMTFEEYFRLEGQSEPEQALRLLVGLSPALLQRTYLVDPSYANLQERRGPSTAMSCQLCAGFAATEALKILLGRGQVWPAPWGLHFDAYRVKLVKTWRPWGNGNPVQRAALAIARRQLAQPARAVDHGQAPAIRTRPIEQILDLARWAPSGDNTQPWRFEIRADDHVVVHGFDTRDHCVYDLDGHASHIAIGALLETIRIAATAHQLGTRVERRLDAPETQPAFDVRLLSEPDTAPSKLIPNVATRSVQRRPLSTRTLDLAEKRELEASVGSDFELLWLESKSIKVQVAGLLFANAKLRLTMREAYEVHRSIIEWNARYSETKVPDQAVGAGPMVLNLMRWALQDWKRVRFLNRYLAGTWLPRLQLDVIPALACAAHVAIVARTPARTIDDYVAAGGAIQRFWLTADKLGLRHQPEVTPLIFAEYARERRQFSEQREMPDLARAIGDRLETLLGGDRARRAVWMGRIGAGPASRARSVRLPLESLLTRP
jgi:molybdopterin/thiamine biosynthesis adenylyltransferase